jgi:hypothetical protein
MNLTYYQILDVAPDAPPEEIVAAYRKLVLERHPDRVPEHDTEARREAEDLFEIFTEAFALLSHPRGRAQYDALLRGEQPFEKKRRSQRKAKAPSRSPLGSVPDTPEAALRQERLRALQRKKRMLMAAGIAAVLAALSPLLIAGGKWLEEKGLKSWWRASATVGEAEKTLGISTGVGSSTEGWWLEDLILYPLSSIEKKDTPNAVAALRGYIKGLAGCYVIPARGSVIAEDEGRARVRIEMQRHGRWNEKKSYMGACTEGFAPIEAYLEGTLKNWQALDLVVVDTDAKLERLFAAPEVKWNVKR